MINALPAITRVISRPSPILQPRRAQRTDPLHLTLIDYPAATIPDITFTHDTAFLGVPANSNKGHVGQISDGIISTQFGHEVTATGPRIKATATYPAGRVYTVTEETDFEGNPTRTVYPSGREVLYTTDNANRITSIKLKDGATTSNLLTAMTYVPMGGLKTALYGDSYPARGLERIAQGRPDPDPAARGRGYILRD